MRLLHSFTKRLLQSDDVLAREGGTNDKPAALFPTDPGALLPPVVYAKRARSRLCLSPGTRQCIDRIAPLAHRAPSPSAGRSQKEAVVAEREPPLPLRHRDPEPDRAALSRSRSAPVEKGSTRQTWSTRLRSTRKRSTRQRGSTRQRSIRQRGSTRQEVDSQGGC